MDDLIHEFLVESHENLDQLDRDFVELEQAPGSREILARAFRTIHTIKGTCGFLGFAKLEEVTHVGEHLLCALRDGELEGSPEITDALLEMVDAVREILACIESSQGEGGGDYTGIVARLSRLRERDEGSTTGEPAAEEESGPTEGCDADPIPNEEPGASEELEADPIARTGPVPVAQTEPDPIPTRCDASPAASTATGKAAAEGTLRVDVRLLDDLMNLVGELVLARNQILQSNTLSSDTSLVAAAQRLNHITTELQEGVMKTRMQPIGNVFSKFPRVVRDLAAQCGKQVRIEIDGKGTELDKTLLEAIRDPLTHLVRNSVGHGIESPEVRRAAGKSEEGCVSLRAYHEGGQVNVEIRDDGAGIDPERIRARVVEKGLVPAAELAGLSDREVVNLVFLPGLSTAAEVTNVSGRGVGMDVVRTNIEKIGGAADIQSTLGVGTTLRIKIPLTLAIVPALTVTCAGARYAIPQVSLLELVRLGANQAATAVETVAGAAVYRLRGSLLPLVYLDEQLGVTDERDPSAPVNIVVLQVDGRRFGLVVDEIIDTQEIVVKPLGQLLQGIPVFVGSTIMGDGCVALILDVLGIAHAANVLSDSRDRVLREREARAAEVEADASETLLLCALGERRRLAIPLSVVARLEEIDERTVEEAAGREVVQYRGRILPLFRLSERLLPEGERDRQMPASEDGILHVVVFSKGGRHAGVVVDRILDIVEETIAFEKTSHEGPCLVGSAVVKGHVTDRVDLEAVIRSLDRSFFEATDAA